LNRLSWTSWTYGLALHYDFSENSQNPKRKQSQVFLVKAVKVVKIQKENNLKCSWYQCSWWKRSCGSFESFREMFLKKKIPRKISAGNLLQNVRRGRCTIQTTSIPLIISSRAHTVVLHVLIISVFRIIYCCYLPCCLP
jgi:hypothetical protein